MRAHLLPTAAAAAIHRGYRAAFASPPLEPQTLRTCGKSRWRRRGGDQQQQQQRQEDQPEKLEEAEQQQ